MWKYWLYFNLFFVCSCVPRITQKAFTCYSEKNNGEVFIIESRGDIPSGYRKTTSMTIEPRFVYEAKKGTLDMVLEMAKEKAKKVGGNVIVVTSHIPPNNQYAVHTIRIDVYDIPKDSIVTHSDECIHPDYASIWLYRYGWYSNWKYDVFIDGNKVYDSAAGTMTEVRFYESGTHDIRANDEKKTSISLHLELGKDYYIEANAVEGFFRLNPWLFVVSDYAGREARKQIMEEKVLDSPDHYKTFIQFKP